MALHKPLNVSFNVTFVMTGLLKIYHDVHVSIYVNTQVYIYVTVTGNQQL